MTGPDPASRTTIEAVYRDESRRVLATLIRLLGDFELAEEALHDAFAAALEQWPADGVPGNPRAWLVSTGRFKAIDKIRRRARFDHSIDDLAGQLATEFDLAEGLDERQVEDDHLRPPLHRLDHGATHRARQGQDPRRENPLQAAGATRLARAARQPAARARSRRPAGPDAAARRAARRPQRVSPSPVVELNRAVALAMRDGAQAGLDLIDAILARGDLRDYHLAHAARADLLRRLGRRDEAGGAYRRTLELVNQGPERRFIERRLAELAEREQGVSSHAR